MVVKNTVNLLSAVSGTGCGGCPLAASYVYGGDGFLSGRTDFRGIYTGFSANGETARQLITQQTEAQGTGIYRTTVTTWSANYRLPTLITVGTRSTGFTYDTYGNALTRTITDKSVNPNVTRTWTYTNDSFGHMLTEDGPRTNVSDLTTYTYYTCTTGSQCGLLNTVTNALGQVTSYDSYNAHGQPTQITDANS